MNHVTYPPDGLATFRTPVPAPNGPPVGVSQPPGDDPAVRLGLVGPAHRRAPRLPPPPCPSRSPGLHRSRHCGVHPRLPGSRTRPRPTGVRHRQTRRTARPGPDLDPPTVGRGPRSRPRDRPPSDPTRPRPTEGRLPADRPDRLSPARSREGRAGRAGLGELEKKVEAGRLRRFDLDAWGFRPSLPTGDSGCLPGQRKWVQHEYPQGRRVNARATHEPFEPVPGLDAVPFERTITSEDLRADLRDRRPSAEVPGWGFGITVAFTSARS
jgi:hypothetical protein